MSYEWINEDIWSKRENKEEMKIKNNKRKRKMLKKSNQIYLQIQN